MDQEGGEEELSPASVGSRAGGDNRKRARSTERRVTYPELLRWLWICLTQDKILIEILVAVQMTINS